MTRINLFRISPSTRNLAAWGKSKFENNAGTTLFAALLMVCSVAVGCSSDKPKPVASTNPSPMMQPTTPAVATPSTEQAAPPSPQAAARPVHKKVVHKVPATVTFAENTSGVSFQYPRRYELKTGDAASEIISSTLAPMDFVQPGGVALAVVAVPQTSYPNSDLARAFFGVSVNKSLTAEQCGEFSGQQVKATAPADPAVPVTAQPAVPATPRPAKLMIGAMELQSAETLASQGTREEASKYFHVFENGACYEFALKVATTEIETEGGAKHADRDEVFQKLEKILATVKIHPVEATAVTASAPATAPATPAQ